MMYTSPCLSCKLNPPTAQQCAACPARQAAEKKEAARLEAVRLQHIEDEEQFKVWLQGVPVMFPASYHRTRFIEGEPQQATDYLKISISGDKVVTSQGAECPLDHAVKALRFYQERKITGIIVQADGSPKHVTEFRPYKTNGHKIPLGIFTLDSIDEAGTVRAGCHTFTTQEITRFINQWKEVLGL